MRIRLSHDLSHQPKCNILELKIRGVMGGFTGELGGGGGGGG